MRIDVWNLKSIFKNLLGQRSILGFKEIESRKTTTTFVPELSRLPLFITYNIYIYVYKNNVSNLIWNFSLGYTRFDALCIYIQHIYTHIPIHCQHKSSTFKTRIYTPWPPVLPVHNSSSSISFLPGVYYYYFYT